MGGLAAFVQARNSDLLQDVVIKGVFGLLFAAPTHAFVWGLSWFVFGLSWARSVGMSASTLAWVITLVFLVVSVGSAWRKVDPLAGLHLAPLTHGEVSRRQVEDAVRTVAGSGFESTSTREGVAAWANLLIAGPSTTAKGKGVGEEGA